MHTCHVLCLYTLADVTWLIHADHMQCFLVNALNIQLNSPSRCAHEMDGACWTFADGTCCWPMSLAKYSYSTYVRGRLGWSLMQLVVVSCQMRIWHAKYVQDLADVFYFSLHMHIDVCSLRTLLSGNIRLKLTDVCRLRMMLIGNVWCR